MRAIAGENFQSIRWRAIARKQSGESSSRGAIPGDQFQNIAWRAIAREQSRESKYWESNPRRAIPRELFMRAMHPTKSIPREQSKRAIKQYRTPAENFQLCTDYEHSVVWPHMKIYKIILIIGQARNLLRNCRELARNLPSEFS